MKIGERVVVYYEAGERAIRRIGTVVEAVNGVLYVRLRPGDIIRAHPKQCRRLKKS